MPRHCCLVAVCAPLVVGGVALAERAPPPLAIAVEPAAPRPPPHPHAGIGGGASFGLVSAAGLDDGWLARLDYELAVAIPPPGRLGPMFAFQPALQLWKAGADWGLGIPWVMNLGVRGPGFRAGVLYGFEAIAVDRVADDTGVLWMAPVGGVAVAVEVAGWHAGVDARVTRRWQLGAPDHTQWQAALSIGRTFEAPLDRPVR
ncbi:MAG: hypothetical protein R3B06_24760 [Kofleriaceae bacterium]